MHFGLGLGLDGLGFERGEIVCEFERVETLFFEGAAEIGGGEGGGRFDFFEVSNAGAFGL